MQKLIAQMPFKMTSLVIPMYTYFCIMKIENIHNSEFCTK